MIKNLKEVIQLLKPFVGATKEISRCEYSTGSVVLRMSSCLVSAIKKVSLTNALTVKLKNDLIKSLKIRLMQDCSLLCLSSLVDPNFKKVYIAPAIAAITITILGKKVKLKPRKHGSRSQISQPKSREVNDENNGKSRCLCHDRT